MPVLREQRRRELATHFWGPTTFFSRNGGRWTESGALERERRSWTSDRSTSPARGARDRERDDRAGPVAELHLGLEARSSAGTPPSAAAKPNTSADIRSAWDVSVADISVAAAAARGGATTTGTSSFAYDPARFGFLDDAPRTSVGSSSGAGAHRGFDSRELNFVTTKQQQQQQQQPVHHQHHQHHHHHQHRQQQSGGRSSPGPSPFSEPSAPAFATEADLLDRDSELDIGGLRSDSVWRTASVASSPVGAGAGASRPPAGGTSVTCSSTTPQPQHQQHQPGGAAATGSSAGGGSGDAQSPPMSTGAPCGACKFLRRKCVRGCIFAPYFGAEQGAARFAAVHKIFGASNVSKLLLHIPLPKRCDAVLTISYEAQARISDPVYGCVATIFALQQQVASLQAELAMVQSQLTSRLAAAAALQQHHHQPHQQQHIHGGQQQHHHNATSAYDTSAISMSIPSPNQNVTGAGPGSAGPYGGSSSRVKEEANFHSFHYDVGMHTPGGPGAGGSSMSIDSATPSSQHQQHLLHLDTYNVSASAQKAAATRHLLGDHNRGEADMGELQALAHALLRRK